MKIPRDYQNSAHFATWNYIHEPANYGKNPLVVEATGLGKSLNIAMFMMAMYTAYPGVRIMNTAHVSNLVSSNYEELLELWPLASAGIYAADLKRRETRPDLMFCMIQSVAKRAASFGRIDFLLVDEAHRLDNRTSSTYAKFIKDLRKINPAMVVIGYTATPYRMKLGHLLDGEMFDEVVYDIGSGESFQWAVDNGYLILPVPIDPGFAFDDSKVKISGGEFKGTDASAAMHDQDIIERAVDFTVKIASDQHRQRSLMFASTIDDAELIAEMFTHKGYPTEAVHSKRNDRESTMAAHKAGDLWGLANKDVLTTGYNDPWLDLMVNLRLTRSPGLWVQMVGRMTRPAWTNHIGHNGGPPLHDIGTLEGRLASIAESHKHDALVLDFCGNTERLGPINWPHMPSKRGKGGGDAPVRKCDGTTDEGIAKGMRCDPITIHHTSVDTCPHCEYVWPVESNVHVKASVSQLVSKTNPLGMDKPPPKEYKVDGVHQMTCSHHQGKEGKKDTMKVIYRCGTNTYPAWVCFEHGFTDKGVPTFPRRKAELWWKEHGGEGEAPTSVEEAVEAAGSLAKPKFLKVWSNTRYPEIVGYDFEGTKFEPAPLDFTDDAEVTLHEPGPDPMAGVIEAQKKAMEFAAASMAGEHYYDDDIPF